MNNRNSDNFTYHGDGTELFKIYIVNWLLTILTLGLYYPWAKASILKYNYQHTEFDGSNFTFHGTGKEMFRGFIKVVAVIGILYGALIAAQLSGNTDSNYRGSYCILYYFAIVKFLSLYTVQCDIVLQEVLGVAFILATVVIEVL